MANLLDMAKGYVTNEIIEAVSGKLGENSSGVSKAIGGLLPTILAGLVDKSSSGNFSGIFNLLSDSKNAGFLDNIAGLVGGGNLAQGDPKDIAGNLMGQLFGNKVGGILDMVSNLAGVKKSSTSSLLGLAGPLVMGMLQKQIASKGLNASGLASLLGSQKSSIMSALPSGMGDMLGFSAPNIEAPKASGGFPKWILWLLAAGVAGFFLWKNCSAADMVDKTKEGMENVADATKDAANKAGDAVADAADATKDAAANAADAVTSFFKRTLPSGFEIEGAETGIENSLIGFIESDKVVDKETWFNFDALRFQTGSDQLDMEYSGKQLKNIVEILKAFPKVNLKVGGYTDSDGDDKMNLALSQRRAANVVKAITDAGIDAKRLAAEGYGEQHPVCPANDTPECKAQNRRIAVRVTAK